LPEAIDSLKENVFQMFEGYMLDIKRRSQNLITFKTATDIAAKMTVGLFEPIFRQIDPMQIGEQARSMAVARAYGERLLVKSCNFSSEALNTLVGTYPSHSFVIDRREAQALFKKVRSPTEDECALIDALENIARLPIQSDDGALIDFLSDENQESESVQNPHSADTEAKGNAGEGDESPPANPGIPEVEEGQESSGPDGNLVQLVKG